MKSRMTLVAVTAVVVGAATPGRAAGKSDIADAVMKGDKAALRALLLQKADADGLVRSGVQSAVPRPETRRCCAR